MKVNYRDDETIRCIKDIMDKRKCTKEEASSILISIAFFFRKNNLNNLNETLEFFENKYPELKATFTRIETHCSDVKEFLTIIYAYTTNNNKLFRNFLFEIDEDEVVRANSLIVNSTIFDTTDDELKRMLTNDMEVAFNVEKEKGF